MYSHTHAHTIKLHLIDVNIAFVTFVWVGKYHMFSFCPYFFRQIYSTTCVTFLTSEEYYDDGPFRSPLKEGPKERTTPRLFVGDGDDGQAH